MKCPKCDGSGKILFKNAGVLTIPNDESQPMTSYLGSITALCDMCYGKGVINEKERGDEKEKS